MIVLAAIAALLALVLALPAAVLLRYEAGALRVRLQVGPVKAALYPRRPPNPVKKMGKRPGKGPKPPAPSKAEESGGKKLTAGQIRELVKLALDLLGKLRRNLLVQHLTLHVSYGGKDAARAAIGYGRAWAVVGAMMPVLENTFRIGQRDVGVDLDYALEQPQVLLDLDVRMRVGTALWLAIGAGLRLLKLFTKTTQSKKKAVQANEPSSL